MKKVILLDPIDCSAEGVLQSTKPYVKAFCAEYSDHVVHILYAGEGIYNMSGITQKLFPTYFHPSCEHYFCPEEFTAEEIGKTLVSEFNEIHSGQGVLALIFSNRLGVKEIQEVIGEDSDIVFSGN